ncbi:uncharacterized protein HMPREF1541_09861 [Cyphellophora europaea CBS 101466]|uniref:Translation initiation factor 3 C-terminal domain-containing protein n=1 Tax=Cyphellophora europaea (strain CBS 101466) TaxID=1220924 RepID=W2S8M9_CYPE1|nr:uncharacterized protein HMPREF1541_09861 [Cyphellophora europaea CBS 101466]ETN44985.1 hypothetical protein HMPREF1541_09861 [Cyphellophora europaea CBS 101466]
MAAALRHSRRLLSPGESLLYALVHTSPAARLTPFPPAQQQHSRGLKINRAAARALPADFDINKLLNAANKPQAEETSKLADQFVLDEAIGTRWCQQRDPGSGKLQTPQLLDALLASIDRSTQAVQLLTAVGPSADTAIVRVVSRAELLAQAAEKERTRKEQAKEKRVGKTKQIELNWAISENDLELKLRQMEKFLEKGSKVEVLLANKKRQRRADSEEANKTLDLVRKRIEDIDGAAERSMEGKVGGQATLLVERA